MSGEFRPYPKRPRFFANHFVRVMAKACVANEVGAEACWLISVIALTEDAKGYREPVTFFNEQLLPLVGLPNVKSLDRVRTKAVASGWLVYTPGGKGKAGRYWVDIPTAHETWDDAPSDEMAAAVGAGCAAFVESKTTKEPGENRQTSGEETARQVGKEPGENRQTSGQHSSLSQDNLNLFQNTPTPAVAGDVGAAMSQEKPAKIPKPAKPLAESVPIPPELDTPTFRGVWSEWLAARRDKRNPVTARAAVMQFKALLPLGAERAVGCIEASIANDWAGIFPDRKSVAQQTLPFRPPGGKRTFEDVIAEAEAAAKNRERKEEAA